MTRRILNAAIGVLIVGMFHVDSIAEDYSETDLQPLIDDSRDIFKIAPADDADRKMSSQTVMRWANNARGSQNGATVIWVHNGRSVQSIPGTVD